jgi:uncharacterized repeat protein (TIGR03803 family)
MKRISIALVAGIVGAVVVQSASAAEDANERTLYSFGGTGGAYPDAIEDTLYGTTSAGGIYVFGTVFALDPKTGMEKVLHPFGNNSDGKNPMASLIDVKGTLYGTTTNGGSNGEGTVFALKR